MAKEVYHVFYGWQNSNFTDAYFSSVEKARQFERELHEQYDDDGDGDDDDVLQTKIERVPYIEGMELDDEEETNMGIHTEYVQELRERLMALQAEERKIAEAAKHTNDKMELLKLLVQQRIVMVAIDDIGREVDAIYAVVVGETK